MKIIKVLEPSQIEHINLLIRNISFQDGKKTATGRAKEVKNNHEAQPDDKGYSELYSYVNNILIKNEWIKKRYLPKLFSSPIINKYEVGDSYGLHFDASHMQSKTASIRKDFSFTLMLSENSEYDGGELTIENGISTHTVKLGAGDMIIYPSIYMHSVLPVTKGSRIAYVGWIASHIKDPAAFEILNAYEDMHLSLLKYDLSSDDSVQLSYVQNRLQHYLSD